MLTYECLSWESLNMCTGIPFNNFCVLYDGWLLTHPSSLTIWINYKLLCFLKWSDYMYMTQFMSRTLTQGPWNKGNLYLFVLVQPPFFRVQLIPGLHPRVTHAEKNRSICNLSSMNRSVNSIWKSSQLSFQFPCVFAAYSPWRCPQLYQQAKVMVDR